MRNKINNEKCEYVPVEYIINKSICEYPSLFLHKTYEDSKHEVLHHLFCVIGTGYMIYSTDKGYIINHPDDIEYSESLHYFYNNKVKEIFDNIKYKGEIFIFKTNASSCYLFSCLNEISDNDIEKYKDLRNKRNSYLIDIDTYLELSEKCPRKKELDNFNFKYLYPISENYSLCTYDVEFVDDWKEALIYHLNFIKGKYKKEDNESNIIIDNILKKL